MARGAQCQDMRAWCIVILLTRGAVAPAGTLGVGHVPHAASIVTPRPPPSSRRPGRPALVEWFRPHNSASSEEVPMSRLHLAVAAALLAALPAAAADARFVKIVHEQTGKVLAVADDSGDSGARTVLAKDEVNEARQWKVEKDGAHYKLVNRKSGKVLDVFEESNDEGAAIIIWDDKAEGNDNQRWSWEGDGQSRRLKAKSSGLVLDVGEEGKL